MGNARYLIYRNGVQIEAGYSVATTCEQPGCEARIDRSLDYLCGNTPGGDETGCGGYFCGEHMFGVYEDGIGQQCGKCCGLAEPVPAMTTPLSDTRLAEIRDLRFLDRAITEFDRSSAAVAATRTLLREVDRLRAVVADHQGEVVRYDADHERLSAELGRVRALVTRAQNAADTGDVAAVRAALAGPPRSEPLPEAELVNETAAPFRNCFTDEACRSSLTDSPERACDRVQAHPAHKHVAQRASWQCPGVAAPTA